MRFLKLSISALVLTFSFLPTQVFAGVNNFYFEDFTGDYYLSRDEVGISHLEVVENITVVFPNFEQNKGICRQIPFTNQDGTNLTLPNLNNDNIKVLRNGEIEPIYTLDKYDTYYAVCTGTDDYVLGTQVYTFEYKFERVITDFDDYQELYWDTNGNGAFQKFNNVTARVHFASEIDEAFDGGKWCYVGTYGENGAERCTISEIDDGWQFSAKELDRFENLTFDVEFRSGTFVVPEPEKNYALVWILVILTIGCGVCLIPFIKKFRRTSEKRRFYKGFFVKPEYQPQPEYTIAEMTTVYMDDKKKDSKIGVLLDMIVKKQIKIIKKSTKPKKWAIIVDKLADITEEGKILLKILNGGMAVEANEEVEIKQRSATASLASVGRSYFTNIKSCLKRDKLVSDKYQVDVRKAGLISIVVSMMIVAFFAMGIAVTLQDEVESSAPVGILVGKDYFVLIVVIIVLIAFVIGTLLNRVSKQYDIRTEKGLEMSRYMDGLKLYIKMAEADRLKMLQSIEGADTSPEGVVHLYEKLLPYAAVFGLEKSWMKEMEKYYEVEDVEEPEWRQSGISTTDVLMISHLMNRYANQSVSYNPGGGGISGGGGFSSGSSGGGGGGFSGGGGGGGGFSGR